MANNAQVPAGPTPAAPSTTAQERTRKVPIGKKKRSKDGMFKVGIWFRVHKLDNMFYFYSDKTANNDYDRELAQVMKAVDTRMRSKVDSARVYHVGEDTRGPEILAWIDGEWLSTSGK
jgi:hypothetical protein